MRTSRNCFLNSFHTHHTAVVTAVTKFCGIPGADLSYDW